MARIVLFNRGCDGVSLSVQSRRNEKQWFHTYLSPVAAETVLNVRQLAHVVEAIEEIEICDENKIPGLPVVK